MDKFKKYVLLTLAVAFLSEIYFYPLTSNLRFAVGVIALNLFILIFDDISELKLTLSCGIAVFLIRNILVVTFKSMTLQEAMIFNYPAMVYYICFGLIAFSIKIRRDKDNLVKTILLLALIDSFSNTVEALIRSNISTDIIKIIILVGLTRSFIAYFVYWFYKKQELYILNREHQKRYSQLNKIISDIQAEMFYLRKSMNDIENVMSKSYSLYETYRDNKELQEKTLNISREVHEIKKDYHRVLSGFENFLKNFENDDTMTLADVLVIIRDNTKRYLKENNKNIRIYLEFKDQFILKTYYSIFSVLNNLIINSIDACKNNDLIRVTEFSDEKNLYFEVSDTGEGIDQEILPYVFNPGFTTKFDEITGKPSTGIGLAHIKNIIEDLEGDIEVRSRVNIGTTIKLTIPKKSLIG